MHTRKTCQRYCRHLVIELAEQAVCCLGIVAHKHHIAAGRKSCTRTRRDSANDAGALHAQIIAEYHSIEAELSAQHLLQPDLRKPGRLIVDRWIYDMRRHYAAEATFDQSAEWN